MLQQRRSSRRFVLSELQQTNKSLFSGNYDGSGGGDGDGSDDEVVGGDNVVVDKDRAAGDSDDPDDGFCIQLEPMAAPTKTSNAKEEPEKAKLPRPRRSSFAVMSLYDRDEPPPTKNEIIQWKSIKNLKASVT